MKKIIAAILMGLAVMVGTDVMAGTACPKGQWLNGKKCAACPTGGKCDGNTMKCDTGNRWVQSGSKCVCQGYWKYKSGKDPNHCYACPKNATCNGGNGAAGIKCNKGFALSGEQCVADKNAKAATNTKGTAAATTCPKGQWLNGKKCAACPANATCDGKTVTCTAKNFKLVGTQCVCSGALWLKNGKEPHCFNCPENGICDGKGNWKCAAGYTTGITDSGANVWHSYKVKPSCVKLKSGDGSVSAVNSNGKSACPKNTYIKGKSCEACPKGARCNGINLEGCMDGYGWDSSAQFPNYCFKCSKGEKSCQRQKGKVTWTSCEKGYHWPWVGKAGNRKLDSTRCVKDGKCTTQNPC